MEYNGLHFDLRAKTLLLNTQVIDLADYTTINAFNAFAEESHGPGDRSGSGGPNISQLVRATICLDTDLGDRMRFKGGVHGFKQRRRMQALVCEAQG